MQQEEEHHRALKKKQDEEQAVHQAEAEEAVMVKTEYLRVEGERIRVEMEAKEDERIRLQCTVEGQQPQVEREQTDSQREGTREETRDEQQIEVDEVQEEGIIQDKEEEDEPIDEQQQIEADVDVEEDEHTVDDEEEEEEIVEKDKNDVNDEEEEMVEDENDVDDEEEEIVEEDDIDVDDEEEEIVEEDDIDVDDEEEEIVANDEEEEIVANDEEEEMIEEDVDDEEEEIVQEEYEGDVDDDEEQPGQITQLLEENKLLKRQLKDVTFGIEMIEANDEMTKFYTGLPTWPMFLHLLFFLNVTTHSCCKLSPENELFLVLVRLRLGLLYNDISVRFNLSLSAVARIVQKWIDIMYQRLSFLIAWPERGVCSQNMPIAFKETYPRCRCIIDCSEIFIETPLNYTARAKTFSNYKKHNTIKFLIGVTPFGTISFLSECWGGRVSDKNLTQSSNFLNKLERGDTILADRGFTVAEDLAVHGATLEIPSFTRGKQQLSQREVELSKQLSRVRIHVERVIGLLKNKFLVLKGPLPISILKHKGDTKVANIDKILTICSALTNLSASIV